MILLDTQVLVWAQVDERRLSRQARSAIRRAKRGGEIAISAFTLYELGSMIERGRITLHGSVEATLRLFVEDILIKPITAEIAAVSVQFPADFPRDPGDRLIAATARVENLPLVTADLRIQGCSLIRAIW